MSFEADAEKKANKKVLESHEGHFLSRATVKNFPESSKLSRCFRQPEHIITWSIENEIKTFSAPLSENVTERVMSGKHAQISNLITIRCQKKNPNDVWVGRREPKYREREQSSTRALAVKQVARESRGKYRLIKV